MFSRCTLVTTPPPPPCFATRADTYDQPVTRAGRLVRDNRKYVANELMGEVRSEKNSNIIL